MMDKKANLNFPARLLPLLSKKDNSVISPYGISAVLAMAAEGASQESLAEILSCLGYHSLGKLRKAVLAQTDDSCEAFKNENTILLQKGKDDIHLLEPFKQTMTGRYSAAVAEVPSIGNPSVMLKNVAAFKAEWLCKMERDLTRENRFCNADGSYSYPAYLSCTEQLRYYIDNHIPTVKAVALPYKLNDQELPFELVLIESEETLDETLLNNIFTDIRKAKCKVELPEFSINSTFDLVPMMKRLGLQTIFDKEAKPFDRIASSPLYAETFEQKAKIQVDEHGTVAKAFTFMLLQCAKGGISPKIETLCFNRPFCYFLRNTNTGEILFMGKVNKLSDCKFRNDIGNML